MKKPWDNLAGLFDSGDRDAAVRAARQNFQKPDGSDWHWLASSLKDECKKWFVAAVFRDYPVPKKLFTDFLDAAIDEANPSFNRQFVEPCVKSFGHRAVNEYLLNAVEGNDDEKIAGAVAALYWVNMQIQFAGSVPEYSLRYATPESRDAYMALKNVWHRKRLTFLRVFVGNEDVVVRRQIIPSLNLDDENYPEELKPLVQKAIEIARSHSDEYIRHRVEVQLGNERLLRPLPERQPPSSD